MPRNPRRAGSSSSPPWRREVDRFLEWKRAECSVGEDWLTRIRWELCRFPNLLGRVGLVAALRRPKDVTPEMVDALRRGLPWQKATTALHFAALRQFLAWGGNRAADRSRVWSLPGGQPVHRRWLTRDQLVKLYRGATGAARVLVALEGFNGLRRVEVLRLRVKDVLLEEDALLVLGKGRHGGKWRKVPIARAGRTVLRGAIEGHDPYDRLLPLSRSGADALLARAARAAGFDSTKVKVSHHDLRRTFGRLAHAAGMDLVQLKNLLGHASVEMTVHYIGLDAETMRAGLERFSDSVLLPVGRGAGGRAPIGAAHGSLPSPAGLDGP